MNFRDLDIRKKLNAVLIVAGAVAILFASTFFYIMANNYFRQLYESDLAGLARILGKNCEAAVAFRVPEDAERVLSSLSARPSVVYAVITDDREKPLADYHVSTLSWNASAATITLPSPNLRVAQDIIVGGNRMGAITLYDDMSGIRHARAVAAVTVGLAALIAMGIGMLLASRMQHLISAPILSLASAARVISAKQDFSLRVEKQGNDEIGALVDDFNSMIGQIEKTNSELRETESRFRTLVDQAVDAFLLFDMTGNIVDANQRACDSLGYARGELLRMKASDIDTGAESGSFPGNVWQNLQLFRTTTYESEYIRRDAVRFPVEVRLGFLEIGGSEFIMGLARDISERVEAVAEHQRLLTQLQQSQKMEAIGTLAGGIAHDFNNILGVIIGNAELARMKLPADNPAALNLDQVLSGSARAADLVKQILAFSRRAEHDKAVVELGPLLKETVKLLRSSIPSSIGIQLDIPAEVCSTVANPTQIHQVVMNLGTNAYHAMREKGGILSISLAPSTVSAADSSKLINLAEGEYVRLTVSDTGCGMEQAVLERIFEPYFTTKPHGQGTGLGLSVVHGIVKSLHGHISVYSEQGRGTIFHVYLPRSGAAAPCSPTAHASIEGGTESILIVDDERDILQMEQASLSSLGYRITAIDDPAAALELLRNAPDMCDLLITDMTMPKMLGTELAAEAMKVRPDLPVILCSGFSDRINEEIAQGMGINAYVMKPFMLADFSRTIRRVLASGDSNQQVRRDRN